ncbi:hypothetical protein JRI60_26645 [Archangium violaceum]|uniref:CAP domain-containing protein n=1 Tax=Archangium violaceum TaxID=83451 RepID=UPI00194F6AB2|nr:CAP domain-containing protein [Archangium violaceum]QRN92792.1 hypothetical protein JRI60_26645 [Archangium violaceum]
MKYEGLNEGHAGLQRGYGENLHWSGTSQAAPPTATDAALGATKSWYDEVSRYNFANGGFTAATGHFTQLVWKSTTSVGCAVYNLKGSRWLETYVVCNYQPSGNYQGQFPQNVLPPRK